MDLNFFKKNASEWPEQKINNHQSCNEELRIHVHMKINHPESQIYPNIVIERKSRWITVLRSIAWVLRAKYMFMKQKIKRMSSFTKPF